MMELITNRLPVKTWNKLKMNEVRLDVPDIDKTDIVEKIVDDSSPDVDIMSFKFDEGGNYSGEVTVDVNPNTNKSIIMDFTSENSGYANVKSIIELQKKSKLTLYQVHRLGDEFRFVNSIETNNDTGAVFELVQIFVSGKEIYAQSSSDLSGAGSKLKIDAAYLTTDDHILDINYLANHIGEKTVSDIAASGALCDNAKKRFRGTIDFRYGSVGAVGNEVERVLLLDEGVVNKTIPIILCAEEDVEGNHGATIGKLDDETLYYMKSRGLDNDTIRTMMKRAYIHALATKLPDEAYRENIITSN